MPSSDITIRQALQADTSELELLFKKQVDYHLEINASFSEEVPYDNSKDVIAHFIESAQDLFLVAQLNDNLVGYMIAGFVYKNKQSFKKHINKSFLQRVLRKFNISKPDNSARNNKGKKIGCIKDCFILDSHRNKKIGSTMLEKSINY